MQPSASPKRAAAPHDNPSTEPEIAASQANVQSSRIAIEHGIRSTEPVVEGFETIEDWKAHRDTVVAELYPVGKLETLYAERAALYLWRLDRVVRYEITATQFDLVDLTHEIFLSLQKPDLSRDRSEAVLLERLRESAGKYLEEFAKWGDHAVKLPDPQNGVAKIRNETKRLKERRILPDQPTIQTIIKYEAHLNQCLARTMTELRRLQKERRQGLRHVEDLSQDHPQLDTGLKAIPQQFQQETGTFQNSTSQTGSTIRTASTSQDQDNVQDEAGAPDRHGESLSRSDSPSPIDEPIPSDAPIRSAPPVPTDLPIESDSPSKSEPSISKIAHQPALLSNVDRISESTPKGIVVRDRNASSVMITMFPQTQYSAIPNVIVRPAPVPNTPQPLHSNP